MCRKQPGVGTFYTDTPAHIHVLCSASSPPPSSAQCVCVLPGMPTAICTCFSCMDLRDTETTTVHTRPSINTPLCGCVKALHPFSKDNAEDETTLSLAFLYCHVRPLPSAPTIAPAHSRSCTFCPHHIDIVHSHVMRFYHNTMFQKYTSVWLVGFK